MTANLSVVTSETSTEKPVWSVDFVKVGKEHCGSYGSCVKLPTELQFRLTLKGSALWELLNSDAQSPLLDLLDSGAGSDVTIVLSDGTTIQVNF